MAGSKKNEKKSAKPTKPTPKTDKEPLSARNVGERFRARVNRAAESIRACAKARRWVDEHQLPPDAVPKALKYLEGVAKKEQDPGAGGFQL